MKKFSTHMKCEVKHNGDMGIGQLWLIMGGAVMTLGCGYGLNGWGSYDKVSCCFVWKADQWTTTVFHKLTSQFIVNLPPL